MILNYQSSNGQVFDLKVGHIRTRTADYHTYKWKPQTIAQQYGERVYRFDKDAVTYSSLLSVFGSLEERRQWLNLLHAAFEHDIINMTPGKIAHGLYSIDCYITTSSTYYEEPWTQNKIDIYCPYPFWSQKKIIELKNRDGENEYPFLDFAYDYDYDFKALLPGYGRINNDAVAPCQWEIVIPGPVTNPIISVDGKVIGVYATIGAEETLYISSKDKTVYKATADGAKTNLFNARVKGESMFEPFPAGGHAVSWSGLFNISLTMLMERSEPPWI